MKIEMMNAVISCMLTTSNVDQRARLSDVLLLDSQQQIFRRAEQCSHVTVAPQTTQKEQVQRYYQDMVPIVSGAQPTDVCDLVWQLCKRANKYAYGIRYLQKSSAATNKIVEYVVESCEKSWDHLFESYEEDL
jgi:Zn-dependent M32 family carboxypeptidase